jgi:hypothetical protein
MVSCENLTMQHRSLVFEPNLERYSIGVLRGYTQV